MEQNKKSFFTLGIMVVVFLTSFLTGTIQAQIVNPVNNHKPPPINHGSAMSPLGYQDTLSLVGEWGWGECFAVAVRGNYVFLGNGSLLQVLDISNSINPQLVSEVSVRSYIFNLVVSGNYVYMVPDFSIIDISDLTHPRVVSSIHIPGATEALALNGDYAYVGNYAGEIFTVNVSDRTAPYVVNGYPMMHTQGGFVASIVVVDSILYASSVEGTLVDIFNIADESSPVHILNAFGYRGPIARQGHYLYLGAGSPYNEFLAYDISDLYHPRYIGGAYLHSLPFSVSVKDSLVYVWELDAGFEIVDISDTLNIHVLARMPYLYSFPKSEQIGPYSGSLTSTTAYIASINGLWIVDISKLPVLNTVSFMATGWWFAPDMATDASHHAFIAEMYGGLKIIDFSNPSSPQLVGQYNPNEAVRDVAVSDNKAYLLCDSDLVILDVSILTTPKLVGRLTFGDTINDNNGFWALGRLAVFDSTVYAARTSKNLYAIDVSNPFSPTIKSVRQTNGFPIDIAKSGVYLYIANADVGFQVFNASNPQDLKESGTISLSALGGFCIDGQNLFALTKCGLSEYEILDSLDLKFIGCSATAYEFNSQIQFAKGFVYICYDNFFVIGIVSGSTGPSIVYSLNNPYGFTSFAISDNLILMGRRGNSLLILKNGLITEVKNEASLTKDFALFQNYPNPFNPATVISYQIPNAGRVVLKVYDILGREVVTLLDDFQKAGTHFIHFDGRYLASGAYVYRLTADGQTIARKMEILK